MDSAEATNTLSLRLYEWSSTDLCRELESGCPLLKQIGLNYRSVAALVKWNERMSSAERKKLAMPLPLRMRNDAFRQDAGFSPLSFKQWNQWYLQNINQIEDLELPASPTAEGVDPAFRKVIPERCLDVLRLALTPMLGSTSRQHSSIVCKRGIGDWKIVTKFTFRRRDQTLAMDCHVGRKDGLLIRGEDRPVLMPTTLFQFYGIGDTTLQVPSVTDGERVPSVMVKLAEHFMVRAPEFFEGLGIAD